MTNRYGVCDCNYGKGYNFKLQYFGDTNENQLNFKCYKFEDDDEVVHSNAGGDKDSDSNKLSVIGLSTE